MLILKQILIGLIALQHFYTLWIEMFAWETKGKTAFAFLFGPEFFSPTKKLAANLGLYNGFLASGLIWTFFISDSYWKVNISIFFLSFIVLAGIYGGVTGSKKVFFFQSLPAILTILVLLLG